MKQKHLKLWLFMLLCMISNLGWAQKFEVDFEGSVIYFSITSSTDLTVAVTYRGGTPDAYNEYTNNIVIPSSVTNKGTTYSVTSIANHAFSGCKNMKNVVIPNTVTSIGTSAFYGCTGLTSMDIPNSVTTIGNKAFEGCTGLTSMDIPNSVTSIASSTFYGCTGLTSINIPNSVISIGDLAFYNCTSLTSIAIPNSVTSIGNSAFMGCTGLVSIEIPNSVISIGSKVFNGIKGLQSLTIPESVTSIGDYILSAPIVTYTPGVMVHLCPNPDVDYSGNDFLYSGNVNTTLVLHIKEDLSNDAKARDIYSMKKLHFNEYVLFDERHVDVNVGDAGMATLYYDHDLVIPDDDDLLFVGYINGEKDRILNIKKLKDKVPENTGILMMANNGTYRFYYSVDEVDAVTDNLLSGVTEKTPVTDFDGTVYTLGRGKNSGYMGFHRFTGADLPANKAFLVRDSSSSVNAYGLVLDNEDGTSTAIGRIESEGVKEVQLIYDMQGRRVDNPGKGIYIVNGKKVIY